MNMSLDIFLRVASRSTAVDQPNKPNSKTKADPMPILRVWWLAVSFEELLKSTLKPQQIDLFALDSPPMDLLLWMLP